MFDELVEKNEYSQKQRISIVRFAEQILQRFVCTELVL